MKSFPRSRPNLTIINQPLTIEDINDIDPVTVRLEMATICMEMNDNETAREILQEIILEAEEPAKAKAQAMLERLNTEMNG